LIAATARVAACGDRETAASPTSERPSATLRGRASVVTSLAFSPDGVLLASGSEDGFVTLWDVRSRQEAGRLEHTDDLSAISSEEPTHRVRSVAFSPVGDILASGSGHGTVALWDVAGREQIATLHHAKAVIPVASLAFSSDGSTLASASYDRTVKLWDGGNR